MSTTIDIAIVLELHGKWLRSEEGGKRAIPCRANLQAADLQDADLRYANLWNANLQGADLWGADLWGADLRNANLQDADLRYANLWNANLQGADLRYANLRSANLRYANLWNANLQGADLRYANLRYANLWNANLRNANLWGTDLWGTYLSGANLLGAILNWNSHTLLSEILCRSAGGSVERRMLAGLIAVSTDWCWNKFLSLEHLEKAWAINELSKWVQPGDGAPEIIREAAKVVEVERLRKVETYHRVTIGRCNEHIQDQEQEIERLRGELDECRRLLREGGESTGV